MQESSDVFRTGKYHKSFGKKNIHLVRRAQLRVFYRATAHLIDKLGWPDPLSQKAPQILLCGTASPYTTVTFARFVRERNLKANLHVLDISPYSLSQSENVLRACQDIDQTRVGFVEGDALNMPFSEEYFDWVETDFFIQYFSLEEKALLFKEWDRVLRPGGIITTRDWLFEEQNVIERVVDRTKNWLIRHILGPIARSDRLQDVKQALIESGFEVAFFPVTAPIIHRKIPLMSYIIIRKPSHKASRNSGDT